MSESNTPARCSVCGSARQPLVSFQGPSDGKPFPTAPICLSCLKRRAEEIAAWAKRDPR